MVLVSKIELPVTVRLILVFWLNKSKAASLKMPFFFLNNHQLGNGSNGTTIRYTYWDTFLSALKPFLKEFNTIPEFNIIFNLKIFELIQ